jgi:succinoglycan biosynthesis protein ExoA
MTLSQIASDTMPIVTVVVPVLNEEAHIAECLNGLLAQDFEGEVEILVLDGGSTDRTRAIVGDYVDRYDIIRLIENPRRLQSAACNQAARLAAEGASVLIRADAHALYPRDFISLCVDTLRFDSITSVVVPMRAAGQCGFQRAAAAVQNSWLGNGGSAHRGEGRSGFVDHGHHAAFDMAFFRQVGGYDERFTHNEDAELDHRMRAAGGRIWMCRSAGIVYFPRSGWRSLARQYFNHGKGRARMLRKHALRPRPRQLAPLLSMAWSAAGLALMPVSPWFLSLPLSYALACCATGAAVARRSGDPTLLIAGPIAMTIHMSWAAGVLNTLLTTRTAPDRLPLLDLTPELETSP